MEYRVLALDTPGTFRCFGEDLEAAGRFLLAPDFLNHQHGSVQLQERPLNGGPDDWVARTWEPAVVAP